MNTFYCRTYQRLFKLTSGLLPWREPALIEGPNSLFKVPEIIKNEDIHRVLILASKTFVENGVVNELMDQLGKKDIQSFVYADAVPNPTIKNVDDATHIYLEQQCQGIIAIGGGSIIDCAKGVAARIARPNKSIEDMKGVLKIRKKTPFLCAVPTTAGTGSEATLAAVISNPKTHEKYAINDPVLIPKCAVLDPILTLSLPKSITATTGMDALTHAIEAYIGRSNTEKTREMSKEAVKLIFQYLPVAYINGQDYVAREKMLRASYCAGVAFTRAYVGNVHAVAHTLSGYYNTPHGLANAVILPYVLEYYGDTIYPQMAELAEIAGVCHANQSMEEKAKALIESIKKMNEQMEIPRKFDFIEEADLNQMIENAYHESNPLYPVPKIFSHGDFRNIYDMIRE